MDIYDEEALSRLTKFPPILKRLPTEIVHQIIGEIPLRRVLQILVHKDSFLDQCIMSHLVLGTLFKNQADIDSILALFTLYTEINRFLSTKNIVNDDPPPRLVYLLAQGSNSTAFSSDKEFLTYYLTLAIEHALPQTEREKNMLEPHGNQPSEWYNPNLAVRWEWIKTAKRNLNQAKARQLLIVADLMNQFPEKLMLKRPLDPSQGSPRKNLKHIEDRLRLSAKRALQHARIVYPPIHYMSYKCKHTIEVIPYDRYLWLFVDNLQKYPVARTTYLDDLVANLTINPLPNARSSSSYEYPPNILADIKLVLEGLKFVYTGNPLITGRRFRWKSRSVISGPGMIKLTFNCKTNKHYGNTPIKGHVCGVSKVLPFDDREYEWLTSFLNVVTWMEKEFGMAGEAVSIPVVKKERVSPGPTESKKDNWNAIQPDGSANGS